MYRFFITRSSRCYVVCAAQVYHYAAEQRRWVKTDRTLEDLEVDKRAMQVASENDLPYCARWVFRFQFVVDSRRVRSR